METYHSRSVKKNPSYSVQPRTTDTKVRPRFFDQFGHEFMYASSGNKHFFTKSCHCQTYQNYEQSRQKLGTILGNKYLKNQNFKEHFLIKVGLLLQYTS